MALRRRRGAGLRRIERMLLRIFCLLLCLSPLAPRAEPALRDGDVLLFRHALAPGGGDPPGFRLDDCSSQRNLSAEGRAQAARLGERVRQQAAAAGLAVAAVWSSPWCRTLDTARLAFPALSPQVQPAFASFFNEPEREAAQLAQARAQIAAWRGPGLLVIVSHQVLLTGLTGVWPASGEGVLLRGGQPIARLPAP